ncbi:hypothetical protein ADK77_10330 [Streptomyces antibioticus]|nr:hypothetical protein ADK77_10330 [Streptomyces antibioticus]
MQITRVLQPSLSASTQCLNFVRSYPVRSSLRTGSWARASWTGRVTVSRGAAEAGAACAVVGVRRAASTAAAAAVVRARSTGGVPLEDHGQFVIFVAAPARALPGNQQRLYPIGG